MGTAVPHPPHRHLGSLIAAGAVHRVTVAAAACAALWLAVAWALDWIG